MHLRSGTRKHQSPLRPLATATSRLSSSRGIFMNGTSATVAAAAAIRIPSPVGAGTGRLPSPPASVASTITTLKRPIAEILDADEEEEEWGQEEPAFDPVRAYVNLAPMNLQNLQETCQALATVKWRDVAEKALTQQSTVLPDPAFRTALLQRGIKFTSETVIAPADIGSLKLELDRRRDSPEPADAEWARFSLGIDASENEATFRTNSWPLIARPPPLLTGYHQDVSVEWHHVDHDSPLARGLPLLQPTFTESFRMQEYPIWATTALEGDILPGGGLSAMPVFAVEANRTRVADANAIHQCALAGAVMTRAAIRAQHILGADPSTYYDKVQCLTITYNGDFLKIFAHHAIVNKYGKTEYHAVPLWVDSLPYTLDSYQRTCRHVRNAQDWCRKRARRTLDQLRNASHIEMPNQQVPPLIWNA